MAGGVRVGIAFDDATLAPAPTWTYLSDEPNLISSFVIDRGRQWELDRTDIGRATVEVADIDGILDPTNTTGPYYGKIEPLLQVQLELYDPVAAAWSAVYRGYIEEADYSFDPSQQVNRLTLALVDALAILNAIEMVPGAFGDAPPDDYAGSIVFAGTDVQTRMSEVLGDAGWPTELSVIFTGNVNVQASVYSPGDTVLAVLQDAADAEFPGLGNVYVSREGIVTFHGRLAKFDPEGVSGDAGTAWPWHEWKAGDGTAVIASIADTAQIREFAFNRGLSRVINQALCTPANILDRDIAAQVVTDPTSIGLRGIRSWSAENLYCAGHIAPATTTAKDETKKFAQYYVDNYAEPRDRVTACAFRSMHPDDARAAATWALLCGAEISDLIDITIGSPGGGGFNAEPWFIEGVHYEVRPLTPDYADVTLRLDLSPKAYYPIAYTGLN